MRAYRRLAKARCALTAEDLLSRLDGVRRTRRGWQTKCPAHDDRNPSLSIFEGERGLLLKCWTGCTLEEITEALGLATRDLFFDNDYDSQAWREARGKRLARRQQQQLAAHRAGLAADARREAERLIQSACGISIDDWSPAQLDNRLNTLADAYDLLWRERHEQSL